MNDCREDGVILGFCDSVSAAVVILVWLVITPSSGTGGTLCFSESVNWDVSAVQPQRRCL